MNAAFWIFMLIMVLLIPATMILFGKRFMDSPPKNISSLFGYRTSRSMKNQDTWEYAHRCFGKLWLWFGIVLLPISIAAMLFSFGKSVDYTAWYGLAVVIIQLIPMAIPMFTTEFKLKQAFDENGRRRYNY